MATDTYVKHRTTEVRAGSRNQTQQPPSPCQVVEYHTALQAGGAAQAAQQEKAGNTTSRAAKSQAGVRGTSLPRRSSNVVPRSAMFDHTNQQHRPKRPMSERGVIGGQNPRPRM
jgi:hypothetical protein